MEGMEDIDGNELIAAFMGYPLTKEVGLLSFDSDWNLLMPVVEKIEGLNNGKSFSFYIVKNECDIAFASKWDEKGNEFDAPYFIQKKESKIQSTWLAVVEFILWYKTYQSLI